MSEGTEEVIGEAQAEAHEAEVEVEGLEDEEGTGFSFNMNETEEDSGFEPLPKGTYLCTIEELTYGLSKSSNKPKWDVKWAVSAGEFAEKNRKIFGFVSFKETQLGRAKSFIKVVAPELASSTDFNPKRIAEEGTLLGRQARLRVDIEKSDEYGNRNRIKSVLPAAGATSGAGAEGGSDFQL